MKNFDEVVNSVREGRGMPNGESPMATLPSALRGAFRAPKGMHFVASDYSMIELRVLAWLTDCLPMLETFYNDLDLYIDFACRMYNTVYDAVTKDQRQIAKPAVLSCGYGSGGGEWKIDKNGDEYKSGLWGYAEGMGIIMTQQQAHDVVQMYRAAYPEVVKFWYAVEDAVRGLMRNPTHRVTRFNRLIIEHFPGKLLRIMLPSGRYLHYLKPELVNDRNIEYDAKDPQTGQIVRRRLYGSLITENLVQAIARDVMGVGLLRAKKAGFRIVGHTHDEIVTLNFDVDKRHNLTYLNRVMVDDIEWAEGLPLKSAGWEDKIYRKE